MALIERANVAAHVMPQETVSVPELGGDVLVRGMYAHERFVLMLEQRRLLQPKEGETDTQANVRAGGEVMPWLLATSVLAADGLPLYTREQWAVVSVQHSAVVVRLFNVAMRLSGGDMEEVEKN